MRIVRSSKDGFVLHLGKHELTLFRELLVHYPAIPDDYPKISRAPKAAGAQASQELLEEALEEHRAANLREIQRWLDSPGRLRPEANAGAALSLSLGEVEWLLQVLNDIRVGSWVRLGSPEKRVRRITKDSAPDVWAMEMSGFYQMHLLEALMGSEPA